MKTIGAAEFKAHCLRLLEEVGPEGIVITKRGKPVAKLVPAEEPRSMREFIGMFPDILVNPDDDLSLDEEWALWDENNKSLDL